EVVAALLAAAAEYQLVRKVATPFDVDGWRLAANAVRLVAADGRAAGKPANSYFVELYTALADALASGGDSLFGIEGREHTALRWSRTDVSGANGASDGARMIAPNLSRKRKTSAGPVSPTCFCRFCSARRPWSLGSTFRRSTRSICATYRRRRRTMHSGRAERDAPARRRSSSPTAPRRARTTSTTSANATRWSAESSVRRRSISPTAILSRPTCTRSGSRSRPRSFSRTFPTSSILLMRLSQFRGTSQPRWPIPP